MSCRREEAAKDCSSAFAPAMKREFFHWPKYSLIVGVIVTSACSASARSGFHARAAASSAFAWAAKSRVTAKTSVGVRDRLAERDLAVAVEVGLDARGLEVGVRAEQRRLGQEEEVARLLEHLAAGQLDVERHGVLGVGARRRPRR